MEEDGEKNVTLTLGADLEFVGVCSQTAKCCFTLFCLNPALHYPSPTGSQKAFNDL